MKIAIASFGNPNSVATWSGIPAHIIPELEKNEHEVFPIALVNPKEPWYYNWLRRWYYRTQNKTFASAFEAKRLMILGRELDKKVADVSPDVVLIIHADYLSHTTFKQPACIIHDATFASLVDYYSQFSRLARRSIKAGNDMYKRAMERCDAAVFSAAWASNSAIKDYHAPVSKIFTIPFGANLDNPPSFVEVEEWISNRSKSKICQFLFLGIAWERKGGPDALKFVSTLNKIGISSRLLIVGSTPIIDKKYKDFVE